MKKLYAFVAVVAAGCMMMACGGKTEGNPEADSLRNVLNGTLSEMSEMDLFLDAVNGTVQHRSFKVCFEEQVATATYVQQLSTQRRNQDLEFFLCIIFHITLGFHIHSKRIVVQQTIIRKIFHSISPIL